jgi:hypothetical protein
MNPLGPQEFHGTLGTQEGDQTFFSGAPAGLEFDKNVARGCRGQNSRRKKAQNRENDAFHLCSSSRGSVVERAQRINVISKGLDLNLVTPHHSPFFLRPKKAL